MTPDDPTTVLTRSDTEDLNVLCAVADELNKARARFPNMNSAHEGYAVILEELWEYWVLCMYKPSHRDLGKMRHELIQVAAMAIRTATDVCGEA